MFIEACLTVVILNEMSTGNASIVLFEGALNFVLVFFLLFLFLKLGGIERSIQKKIFKTSYLPVLLLEYDFINKKWHIDSVTGEKINIDISGKLADYKSFFKEDDWNDIIIFSLKEKPSYFEKSGTLSNEYSTYKFFAKYIEDNKLQVSSLLIWLVNWDREFIERKEVIGLFKRYRVLSYELDLLINSLPFSVWRRNDKGEMIIYNQACKKLLQKNVNLDVSSGDKEIQSALAAIFRHGIKSANQVMVEKHFIINNRIETIRFVELTLSDELGNIGFALDAREQELLEKNVESLIATLEKVMELSRSAIIIVDSDRKVSQFNQVFINYFEIDPNWLSEKPSYSLLLDKLRENKKLPEVNDYRGYKNDQLRLISELTSPYHELLHLQSGQTLRFSVVPTTTGDTILIYDNITDILSIERSYNELAAVYKTILSCLDEAIIIVGQNGKIKLFNQKALSLLNLGSELLETLPHYLDILSRLGLSSSTVELINDKVINTLEYQKDDELEVSYQMHNVRLKLKALPDFSALLLFTRLGAGIVDSKDIQRQASNE